MILILDGDRTRGEQTQRRLYDLYLLSDVTTYASLRNRLPSLRVTDRVDFVLLLRPDDPARPPLFFKSIRKQFGFPTVLLGGDATFRPDPESNAPDLILSSELSDRAILREIRSLLLSMKKPDPWDRIAGGVRDRTEYADHTVYGVPVRFSRAERIFLRALILAFPDPVPVEEMQVRAAPPKERKTLNALKVIASKINRKSLAAAHRKIVNRDADRFWILTSKTDPSPAARPEPDEKQAESYNDEYRYYPHNAF